MGARTPEFSTGSGRGVKLEQVGLADACSLSQHTRAARRPRAWLHGAHSGLISLPRDLGSKARWWWWWGEGWTRQAWPRGGGRGRGTALQLSWLSSDSLNIRLTSAPGSRACSNCPRRLFGAAPGAGWPLRSPGTSAKAPTPVRAGPGAWALASSAWKRGLRGESRGLGARPPGSAALGGEWGLVVRAGRAGSPGAWVLGGGCVAADLLWACPLSLGDPCPLLPPGINRHRCRVLPSATAAPRSPWGHVRSGRPGQGLPGAAGQSPPGLCCTWTSVQGSPATWGRPRPRAPPLPQLTDTSPCLHRPWGSHPCRVVSGPPTRYLGEAWPA